MGVSRSLNNGSAYSVYMLLFLLDNNDQNMSFLFGWLLLQCYWIMDSTESWMRSLGLIIVSSGEHLSC